MNAQYLLLFSVVMTFLVFVYQRTESKKRLTVLLLLFVPAILIRNWIVYRDLDSEGITALGIALLLNFVFWVLIGRYNPVGSSDEIQVLGMDD